MYLSKLHLQNWRSYADATFTFNEPTEKRSVVLIGAMNGHGKTSFLISLYLGLFGKFGLRHCEGFGLLADEDYKSYRDAVSKFRRNSASSDEPTVIDITLTSSWRDTDEEEIRIVRRWFFSGRNEPRQGDAFEEVDLYVGGRLQKGNLDKDQILLTQERVEKHLFPPHVAPAFFFDGEQAQKLIETSGEDGLKRAVRVMFGTKVVEDLTETMRQYLARVRQNTGGKRKTSDQQVALESKLRERQTLNEQIAKKQSDLQKLEHDKDLKEQQRGRLHEDLARMGGTVNANAVQIQGKYVLAEKEQAEAEKALGETVKNLGLSLAVVCLAPAIRNRLKAEEQREGWENLMRGTIENRDKVLATAMPEPDPLLGNLSSEIREKVRNRFGEALERIYNPPPFNCPDEYLLGHVKGEAKVRVLAQLAQAQSIESTRTKAAAKRLRDARESLEEAKRDAERLENLPKATKEIKEQIDGLNSLIQESIRHIGALENEIKVAKATLKELSKQIGEIQEELARLGPEQQRIAIAERVCRALEDLQEKLTPTTTARLEAQGVKTFCQHC